MIRTYSSLTSTTPGPGYRDSSGSWPTSTLRWITNRGGWRLSRGETHSLTQPWASLYQPLLSCFSVNTKFIEHGRGFTIEEAKAIRAELLNIQQSLSTGEQEKIELMKSLACLKDDLTRLQPSESSLDVSVLSSSAQEKLSTASQTDLSGEVKIFRKNSLQITFSINSVRPCNKSEIILD